MSDYGSVPPPPPPSGGGAPGPIDHPKGVTILVLGILGLVCCQPVGIAAWLMGNNVMQEIDADPSRYANRQLVQIGRILGIVATVLFALTLIWVLFFGGLAVLTSAS